MPVILRTQHTLLKPSPWSAFSFKHEISKRPETKIPKQYMPMGPLVSRDSGEAPAAVVTDYSANYRPPLEEDYVPSLLGPSPVGSSMSLDVPEPLVQQQIYQAPVQQPIPQEPVQQPIPQGPVQQPIPQGPIINEYAVPGGFPTNIVPTETPFVDSVQALETAIEIEGSLRQDIPTPISFTAEEGPSGRVDGKRQKKSGGVTKKTKKVSVARDNQEKQEQQLKDYADIVNSTPLVKRKGPKTKKFNVPRQSGVKRPGTPLESRRVGKMPVPKNVPRVAGKKRPGPPMESGRKGFEPGTVFNKVKNPLGLKIDTSDRVTRTPAGNPKGMRNRKPKEPTELDLTQITAANIVGGKRQKKTKGVSKKTKQK